MSILLLSQFSFQIGRLFIFGYIFQILQAILIYKQTTRQSSNDPAVCILTLSSKSFQNLFDERSQLSQAFPRRSTHCQSDTDFIGMMQYWLKKESEVNTFMTFLILKRYRNPHKIKTAIFFLHIVIRWNSFIKTWYLISRVRF